MVSSRSVLVTSLGGGGVVIRVGDLVSQNVTSKELSRSLSSSVMNKNLLLSKQVEKHFKTGRVFLAPI